MNKILFIIPPHITFDDFINPFFNARTVQKKYGNFGSVSTEMPLGVLSLSAYVKKNAKAETKLVDFNIILNKLASFEFSSFADFFLNFFSGPNFAGYTPDIIAISALFTPAYQSMLDIAQYCRSAFPNAVIIAGGGIPTNMPDEIFKNSECFDALCYGEGEKPLLELVKADDKIKYLEDNPSWITRKKIKNGQSFKYDFIENLDEIPFYDYDLCEIKEYAVNPGITSFAHINESIKEEEKKQNFHIITSRGCPFRCCFCASHSVHGRKMRYHSLDRVREDLKRLRDQYGAKIIFFQDDQFLLDRKRALLIIDMLKELKMAAVFQGLALFALDKEMLCALKSAGINSLILPVESGSERVLKEIMHKPLNLSIVKRVVDDCRELGIYTDANVLIGLPGETKKDIEDARLFLKTIGANWFHIHCAGPLAGSEMYEICKEKNYLAGGYVGADFRRAVVQTEDFTSDYIQKKAYMLNLELNFVENNDFRLGNYKTALLGFEHALSSKNDHAIAYYYAAKCYEKLGNSEKAQEYMNKAKTITVEQPFWRNYADMFNVPI
ncbi:MAG: radical SAM protein [Patescibacteria group bacterium]